MTRGAVLAGLGSALPDRVVTNAELARHLDTSEEWIRSRTGILQRYVCDPGTSTSDLAVAAGLRALRSAGEDRADAVILATTTPDQRCPATAPAVAARLGLGTVPAFDVSSVCTGFLYALATAQGLVSAGTAERVLVIGAEVYSSILDPDDRSTRVIFGDGAGAVLLRAGEVGEPGALGRFHLGSDGTGAGLIGIEAGGVRRPFGGGDPYFRMDGRAVFRQAVERMSEAARAVLATEGWESGPDVLVAHQANVRILHAVADQLDLDRDRCVVDLDRVGNTAAASIPLALAAAADARTLLPGDRVVCAAFGGGLSWGACGLRWPSVTPL